MALKSNAPMDELDLSILAHLRDDGRKSFTAIAGPLDVSVGTVRNRIARMLSDKTLSIVARVHPHRAGFDAYASVFVSIEPAELTDAAIKQIGDFPEVSFLARVAGEFHLQVDVMCRDNSHLTELVTERLQRIPGVRRTSTMMILRVYKYGQADLNLLRAAMTHNAAAGSGDQPADAPLLRYR
ncbi:MAG: Lrp/AsnC family transcriptional regulator [Anaerolineales bacterium]|jgi:Lrp/AsnC family transcriptional regulator for asnA, asnC and gidA|nr:Lrp/AsnC family transcriptional regulator [Anaerolineales bacterium]HJO32676.1 Lrp/AsnC family transcriptional regulator [Anaerolineales bacterium]|tara:strand:+ start:561 stop:1109 length:549 start_codon:yes stop_codon:yes gene_type:complete